jgi:hypothetical protein
LKIYNWRGTGFGTPIGGTGWGLWDDSQQQGWDVTRPNPHLDELWPGVRKARNRLLVDEYNLTLDQRLAGARTLRLAYRDWAKRANVTLTGDLRLAWYGLPSYDPPLPEYAADAFALASHDLRDFLWAYTPCAYRWWRGVTMDDWRRDMAARLPYWRLTALALGVPLVPVLSAVTARADDIATPGMVVEMLEWARARGLEAVAVWTYPGRVGNAEEAAAILAFEKRAG